MIEKLELGNMIREFEKCIHVGDIILKINKLAIQVIEYQ